MTWHVNGTYHQQLYLDLLEHGVNPQHGNVVFPPCQVCFPNSKLQLLLPLLRVLLLPRPPSPPLAAARSGCCGASLGPNTCQIECKKECQIECHICQIESKNKMSGWGSLEVTYLEDGMDGIPYLHTNPLCTSHAGIRFARVYSVHLWDGKTWNYVYLSIYRSIDLSIDRSIHPSIYLAI